MRIGISGWTYAPWRGVFYPKELAQRRELEFASHALNSIEINGSFYSLQRPSSYEKWRQAVPPGFVFAIKGSRYITHMLKLAHVETALANFFASGVLALGKKLGPILWQFPPQFGYDRERFETFLDLLPTTSRFDATQLIQAAVDAGHPVYSYPIQEYWLDMGDMKDYEQANADAHRWLEEESKGVNGV